MKNKIFILISIMITPMYASAAFSGLGDLISSTLSFFKLLIPIAFTLALLYFFWGVAMFISKSGESDISEGKAKIFWGVIGLVSISCIWGILYFINPNLRPNTNTTPPPPEQPNPCNPDPDGDGNYNPCTYGYGDGRDDRDLDDVIDDLDNADASTL